MKAEQVNLEHRESGKLPYADEKMKAEQANMDTADPDCTSQGKLRATNFDKGDNQALNPSRIRCKRLSALVLSVYSIERIGYYGALVNLVLYSTTHIGFGDLEASTIFTVYMGFNLIFSFVVGILNDAFIGTFRTTVISFLTYIPGMFLLSVSALELVDWSGVVLSEEAKKAIFLSSLVLIAVGSGGFLATILPFGAHHIEALGSKATSSFYMWAYWAQNVPLLLTFSVVSYLQQSVNFFWGYFLLFCTTVIAFLLFLTGKNYYMRPKVKATAIKLFFSVLRDGTCRRRRTSERGEPNQNGFLAKARAGCGGRHCDKTVDDVKDLLKVIPVALLMILYWCLYIQYVTTFVSQAVRMDLTLGDFQIPVSSMALGSIISVVLFLPLVNHLLIPFMEKIKRPLMPFRRMAIGMFFFTLVMITAGLVELHRKEQMDEPGCSFTQEVSDKNFTASCVSVFLQVPQYTLFAISEIFTVVAAQELSFTEAPEAMKSLVSGMFIAAMGLGGFAATAVALLITEVTTGDNAWLGEETNEVKMENFFFLLSGLMGLNLLLGLMFSHFYKYRNQRTRPRMRSGSLWSSKFFSGAARLSFSDQGESNAGFTDDGD